MIKKTLGFMLSLIMVLGCVFAVPLQSAAAGNTVAKEYVQMMVRKYALFIKKDGYYNQQTGLYTFDEKPVTDEEDGVIITNEYLYSAGAAVGLACKVQENTGQTTQIILNVPFVYNTYAEVYLTYTLPEAGKYYKAEATISIPNFQRGNAIFIPAEGTIDPNFVFQQQQFTDLNAYANKALEAALFYLNDTMIPNKKAPSGILNFGFCAYCGHDMCGYSDPASATHVGYSDTKICQYCGLLQRGKKVIPKIASVKLNKTAFPYNGKVQPPTVIVKDTKGKVLKYKTDYTLSYSKGRKNIGKYAVTVQFRGNYSGKKVLTYTITPAKTAITALTPGKNAIGAQWKKVSGISGYQVSYATNAAFKGAKTVTVKGGALRCTLKQLNSGTKYYVRVRSYKVVGFAGKKVGVTSAWSAVKTAKTK